MKLWDKFKALYARRWFKIVTWIVLILLLLGGVFRMCTGTVLLGKKTYHIARNTTWPPLDLMGKEPYVTAFTTDVMTDIAIKEKLKVIFFTLDNPVLFDGLDSGEYDAILIDILPNSFMREHYDLSDPLILTGPVLVVPASSSVTSLAQLDNKGGIGVRRGSPNVFKISQDVHLTLVPYDNMITALDDLYKGTLVGAILENPIAHIYMEGLYKGKLKIATPPLTDEGIRLITHWDSDGEQLIDKFDKGLKEMRADGTFEKLVQKWTLYAE